MERILVPFISSSAPLVLYLQVIVATLLLLRPCPSFASSSSTAATAPSQHPHNIVSTADNALPMSLSTVVSDLEAEGCCAVECDDETGAEQTVLTTACLVTSRSVSKRQRVRLLEELLQAGDISHNDAAGTADLWTAVATTAGLALAQPPACENAAAAACACGGTVLFAASDADLARGEGVMDALAPAVEKLLAAKEDADDKQQEQQQQQRHLYVLLMDGQTKEVVQPRLERVAATVLANLVVNHHPQQDAATTTVTTLQDVFDHGVDYLTPREAAAAVLQHEKTTPAAVAAQVAQLWNPQEMLLSQLTTMTNLMNNGANLAAARTLGPAARQCVREALEQVTAQCTIPGSGGEPKLVTNFGQLADAAVQQAVAALDDAVGSSTSKKSSSSSTAQQIRANLRATLDGALQDLWAQQMELLQEAQFDEFKRSLSKLLVSPNLQRDMQAAATASVAAFAKAARKLVPKTAGSSSWSSSLGGAGGGYTATAQQQAYRRRLHDYVANRILNAQAAGKFKPLPRKGVTVGLHWLLPKPFGHDYRQEPWTVHATDDMVYVPPSSKLSDVSAADVAAGTWRDQLVPSPAGNDMLYMQ